MAAESNPPPLAGVRVVEVASWVMVPSAGAILAANGADVVKVEPSGSADPSRATTFEIDGDVIEPGFELSNSGKRGITLDLRSDAGQEVLHRLLDEADVFLTNVRPAALERAGLVPDELHARYPELVIAHGTGYGLEGAEADRPAFDELAYWARGGIGRTLAPADEPPVQLVGAMGDLPSGVALVAGVMTALFRRERGEGGAIVDVSLLGTGLWTNGWELQQALIGQPRRPTQPREARLSPLYNCYRCADGRWVQFAMYQAGRRRRLEAERKRLDALLEPLVSATAPELVASYGVGTDTAGALLVSAGDNPQRLRSEAAFAHHCGVAPIDASSGLTIRKRLNRGGDRTANQVLWRIVMVRMVHDPRTRRYVERRTREGRSKREIIRSLKRYVARQLYRYLPRAESLA